MKLLRVSIITVFAYVLFLPSISGAQLPRGNWWENEKIKEALQITEDQVQKIKEITARSKEGMEKLREEYMTKRKGLKGNLSVEKLRSLSEEEIDRLIDDLQSIRIRMEKARFLTMVKTLKVFSEEQAVKLAEKQKYLRKQAGEKLRHRGIPGDMKSREKGKE